MDPSSQMAGSSNQVDASARIQDLKYLYASIANLSNFVSVKLSSDRNYHLWKTQMLCLMKSHNMAGIVENAYESPVDSSEEKIMDQYDSLLKGWIFGSVSENVLGVIVDLASAKEVWVKLKSFYDVTVSHQQALTKSVGETEAEAKEAETNIETKDVDVISAQTSRNGRDTVIDIVSTETETEALTKSVGETETEGEDPDNKAAGNDKTETKKNLLEATMKGDWTGAHSILKEDKDLVREAISSDGSPILHIAVGRRNNDFVKNLFSYITDEDVLATRSSYGSTALDIATFVGNIYALDLLCKKIKNKKNLREATMKGNWSGAESILKEDKDLVKEVIRSSDGSKILHIAVGIGNNDFAKNLFSYINEEDVLATRSSDESTALHIAAIVGNKYAADLLLKKNKRCLRIKDKMGKEPLQKAYENMHLDTIGYLLKVIEEDRKSEHPHPEDEMGVNLLVNVISAKQYNLALELIEKFPKFASKNDEVLMAIAKTFPSGDYEETYIPCWKDLWALIYYVSELLSLPFLRELLATNPPCYDYCTLTDIILFLLMVPCLLMDVFCFLYGLILLPYYLLSYLRIWITISLVEPIMHIQKKKEEMDEAEKVLKLVCDEIDKMKFTGTHHPYYTRPILVAACQNAHKVVDEILYRSPEAILSTDQGGYDIIQLAVIHRSERIYNLIYDIGERKNIYRTIVDSSKNNIVHLAGRLAPSSKLNKRTGAALQLQRELQWREEVKKHVFPTYITQENIFKETPHMVFTREHEKLVKEGEQWMKTTAESCSITAALITTIVFAAAITVPGGSNQETGIPVFTKDIPFIIFAVSDAISLFASSTALLVFLSILTARFSEEDFLVSLPRRLLIGICSLLLSAISMMVAFSSTLYLVFCHQKLWMLAPICGLSLIPISFFVALQLPLIVDLFQSTYQRKFGPRRRGKRARFNPDSIRLFFGK